MTDTKPEDRVALITGASSGIGLHFARRMAERGFRLAVASSNAAKLGSRFEASDTLLLQQMDVRDSGRWQEVLDETTVRFGRLDYLFNIAGVVVPGLLRDLTPNAVDRHMDVNAKGMMYGTMLASTLMLRQGFGHIINVASLAGVAPVPGIALYSASKFAVRGFSLAAANELAGTGVDVTVVCTDLVDTPMLDAELDHESSALVFSGPRPLTVEEVSRSLFRAMEKRPREILLPASRGLLAKIASFAPGLATMLSNHLERKGLENMQRLRASKTNGTGRAEAGQG